MNTRFWFLLFPLGLLSLLSLVSSLASPVFAQNISAPLHDSAFANPARVSAALAHTPVMFIENAGQFDAGARFQVRGGDGALFLADDALWVTLLEKTNADNTAARDLPDPTRANAPQNDAPQKGVNLKFSFVGANAQPRLEPFDRLDTHVSYFIGSDASQWHPDVPVWEGVRYKELYPGIDLELTSENGQIVQRLVAREGANLDAVQLRVEGADTLTLDDAGLRVKTAVGEYALPLFEVRGLESNNAPQPALAENVVRAPFTKSTGKSRTLDTNNSSALLYSTFLGGGGYDLGSHIVIDINGNPYVTGMASSGFPTTPGAFQTVGGADAFVSKLNSTGTALVYSTFLGGSRSQGGASIALDAEGNVYVTGGTNSSDFPTTPGAFQRAFHEVYCTPTTPCGDAFVSKLNATGTALEYSTYLGGDWDDGSAVIALDANGNAYVTGSTLSSDFPTTPGVFNSTDPGAFVTKLNATGTALEYSTFLGGGYAVWSSGIVLDANDNVYMTGTTTSSDFPTTSGAFQPTIGGASDAFVAKLNVNGSALEYSTFLGGSSYDGASGIALDTQGNIYLTGDTWSFNFPITSGAFQRTIGGSNSPDAFVTKLNIMNSALVYSTFLGGTKSDQGNSIALDADGNAYVTGDTDSPNFAITPGAFQTTRGFFQDAFLTKLNASGAALEYSTFLGGYYLDTGTGIALDANRNAYVTGMTGSADFPTTPGAFQTTFGGYYDAFVTQSDLAAQTCATKPAKPVLKQPKKGGIARETRVWLSWNAAKCEVTYSVVVYRGFPTGKQVQKQHRLNVARFLTKSLKSGTTYYWRVTACNTFGCAKSDWWHFTVK